MPAKNCTTEQILATQRALRSRKEAMGRTMPAKDCTTIGEDAGLQVLVETDDELGSEGDEYPFNWFDLVAGEGSPPWLQAMLPNEE